MTNIAEKLIQQTHDKKDREFFDVRPDARALNRAPIPVERRQQQWMNVFGESVWFERSHTQPERLFVCFKNGLQITDNDREISFGAQNDKASVKQSDAISFVRRAANHLYRRGDTHLEIGSNYAGAEPYMNAFADAYREVRNVVNKEKLEALALKR